MITAERRTLGLLAVALLALGCGGKQGNLDIQLVTSASDDPFAEAAAIRLRFGDPPLAEQTVPVAGGQFAKLSVELKPKSGTALVAPVIVELLDGQGQVVGRGRSPQLALLPAEEALVVYVGRVGRFAVARASFGLPRVGAAVAPVPRLGLVSVGGSSGGKAQPAIELYSAYGHVVGNDASLPRVGQLPSPRSGAVSLGFDRADQPSGAALIVGGAGDDGALAAEVLLFDARSAGPTVYGVVSPVRSDPSTARREASAGLLPDGSFLLSGGLGADGKPLATATVVAAAPQITVTPGAAAMATPRRGHTATPIQLAAGGALLLFGGDTAGAAAETYLAGPRTFTPRDLAQPSRSGHGAVSLPDGRALVVGGRTAQRAALADGFVVAPDLRVTPLPSLLSAPRADAAVAIAGGDVLICGGSDERGLALASCDVVDAAQLTRRRTIPLGTPRRRASLTTIDGGYLVLTGGVGPDDKAVGSIEIYVP